MVAMYGLGPVFDSMGLINTIYSYTDTIAISFTCDRVMMPDPDVYSASLRQAFEALKAAAANPAPAPAPVAATARTAVRKAPAAKPKAPPKAKAAPDAKPKTPAAPRKPAAKAKEPA
jgi:hypothetical protein